MIQLPEGWTTATINEVAQTSLGKMLDAKRATGRNRTPYLRNINVRWGSFDLTDVAAMDITPEELERVLARIGDVIACEGGEPGRAAVWRHHAPVALQKALHRIRPFEGVSPDFVALLLRHQAESGTLCRLFTGTTIKHLPQEKLRLVSVPLPPSAEQERIVTAIDEVFSKLDAGEAGLRTVRQLLKRMRQAVLTAAVTGRLVPQDPTDTPATKLLADLGVVNATGDGLPEGWARVRLGDAATVGSGTTPRRGDAHFWEGGTVPWVSSGLIANGIIREAREFVTDRALTATSLRLWPPGTLLVAMYGEGQTRGRCAELGLDATCNQACAAISLREPLALYKDFVRLSFDANYSANRRLASGGVQPNLNAGLIKDIVLALPPPEEQARIVAEVERQLSFIEACERMVDVGLVMAAALRRSVLKEAFEGRLVPQDPSDQPASVLLGRIRAERSVQPLRKRRARQTA